jgi:SAM-dependent methyltransferase
MDVRVLPGDAEHLPFGAGEFDVVASSFALQWVPQVPTGLSECVRVCRPGGLVALAVPVRGSLGGLHEAARLAGLAEKDVLFGFPQAAVVEDHLARLGVRPLHAGVRGTRLEAPSARELFRRLRRLGVQTAGRRSWRLGPNAARALLRACGERAGRGPASAEFRTLLFVGRRPGDGDADP